MRLSKLVLCVIAATLVVLAMPAVFACELPPGYSPGYWKHNVRVYVQGRGSYSGVESAATMESYEAYIAANIYPGFTLEWANTRLWDNQYKYMWLDVANWFNEAAGLAPY